MHEVAYIQSDSYYWYFNGTIIRQGGMLTYDWFQGSKNRFLRNPRLICQAEKTWAWAMLYPFNILYTF